jgi:hypothetical protein
VRLKYGTIPFVLGYMLSLPYSSFPADMLGQGTKGDQAPIVNVGPGGESTINYNRPKVVSHMIWGTFTAHKHTRHELDGLSIQQAVPKFDLSLDDPIQEEYFMIKLRIKNMKAVINEPVTFHIFSGAQMSKILDVKSKVMRPKNKLLKMTHSIPKARWVWPIKRRLVWEGSDDKSVTYNIYKSFLPEVGYGRVNPIPLTSSNWEIAVEALDVLKPVYYRISAENMWNESSPSEPIELQNSLSLSSFVKKEGSVEKMTSKTDAVDDHLIDESQQDFAKGRVRVTFENGLDAGADIELYILCKMLPDSTLEPSAKIEGSPSINFELKGKIPTLRSAPKRTILTDKLKTSITPPLVRHYASLDTIYLTWEKPKSDEFAGVRIFRLTEGEAGIQQEVSISQEIYHGPGFDASVEVELPEIKDLCIIHPSMSTGTSFKFLNPPPPKEAPDQPIAKNSHLPLPPSSFAVWIARGLSLTSNYYIDRNPERDTVLAYVIYAYDKDGRSSWPIVVKAALPKMCTNLKVESKIRTDSKQE